MKPLHLGSGIAPAVAMRLPAVRAFSCRTSAVFCGTSSAPWWPEANAANGLDGTAFLKSSCWRFSCPDAGLLSLPPTGSSVDAASCCTCPAPSVKDLTAAPNLRCEPCDAGRASANNGSACEACPLGEFARPASLQCTPCGEGFVPSEDRGFCEPCQAGKSSPGHVDVCDSCGFPRILHENSCIWWHLPLVTFGVVCFLVSAGLLWMSLVRFQNRRLARRAAAVEHAMAMLYDDLWEEVPETVSKY